jgi:predicted nuclease of predicted toxin-antitoxin system
VKLLLDEMHAPAVAEALTDDGWDIVAVAARVSLRGAADEDLLAYAATEGRVLVTESIPDFAIIARRWAAEQRPHTGLIFTNPRRFNRATMAYPGNVVAALRALLEASFALDPSGIWWL